MKLEQYNPIQTGFDKVANSNYVLYSIPYKELVDIVKSWYSDIDVNQFDSRLKYRKYINEAYEMTNKISGIVSNIFTAYKTSDRYFLLDGYKRLLSDYAFLDVDVDVYIKVYVDELSDTIINKMLFMFNNWKLYNRGHISYVDISNFFDRGMKLFYKSFYDIEFYQYDTYDNKLRYFDDIKVINSYFQNETELFERALESDLVLRLMCNVRFIDDIRQILKINDYLKEPFGNYSMFIESYCRFISYMRINGVETDLNFEYYLEELKSDKKLFKKICSMSGTDSTRKNFYAFFKKYEKF